MTFSRCSTHDFFMVQRHDRLGILSWDNFPEYFYVLSLG
jgi:hypothetical protein